MLKWTLSVVCHNFRCLHRYSNTRIVADMLQYTTPFPPPPTVASAPIFDARSTPLALSHDYGFPSASSQPSQSTGYVATPEFDPWALTAAGGVPASGTSALTTLTGTSPTGTTPGPLSTPTPLAPRCRTGEKGRLSGPSRPVSHGDIDAPPIYSA